MFTDSPDALDRIKQIKEMCPECNGAGYRPVTLENGGGIRFDDCACVKEMTRQFDLVNANIPRKYWNWDFRKLTSRFKGDNKNAYKELQAYLEDIKENIQAGNGLWLASNPGLAKSSIICYFLREALKTNVAYFERASHIISYKFDALNSYDAKARLGYIIGTVDMLAMEEIEKVYLKTDIDLCNQMFYEFLSDVYDSGKALLISSNTPRKEVFKVFPSYIQDRLMTLKYLPLVGGYSGRHPVQEAHG
jgi:DNA replication protein DnaC